MGGDCVFLIEAQQLQLGLPLRKSPLRRHDAVSVYDTNCHDFCRFREEMPRKVATSSIALFTTLGRLSQSSIVPT